MVIVYIRGGSIYRKYRDISPISMLSVSQPLSMVSALQISAFRYIDIISVTSELSAISYDFITLFNVYLKTNDYLSKIKDLIWQCDIRKGSCGKTLTSLTTSQAIMKICEQVKECGSTGFRRSISPIFRVANVDIVSISAKAISTHLNCIASLGENLYKKC